MDSEISPSMCGGMITPLPDTPAAPPSKPYWHLKFTEEIRAERTEDTTFPRPQPSFPTPPQAASRGARAGTPPALRDGFGAALQK